MATDAADTLFYMDGMIEVNEVRLVMDARPLDGTSGRVTVADRLNQWAIRPDLGMARHAGVRRWQTSERGLFNRRMAVTTIDAVVTNVMFVTELNRLLPFNPLAGVPRRTV